MDELVKLKFYCGCYKVAHDYSTEADECCNEGVITVSESDWTEGCVSHKCNICGNTLYQMDDHFEEEQK